MAMLPESHSTPPDPTSAPAPAGPRPAEAAVTGPMPPPRPIRFVHRGVVQSVQGLPSTLSVLAWLREHAGCTGTKEGCNEGDCGACTVLVGELDAAGRAVELKPVNSCIQFLPTLDGKALVTVEDLGGQHPAQQALVACHGSQCGFCTPGFVMSLAASYQRQPAGTVPSRQQLADDLSGNLCRCTGYRPILDAGQRMFDGPRQPIATAPLVPLLQALRADAPLHYAAATPFHAPRSLADLAALRLARPQARLLAGSTDVGLWVNKQFRDLDEVIYVGEVAALKAITTEAGLLRIGAGASLEAAWAALAAHWPALREMVLRFASRPVREAGTMGGNLANGSPIGDSAPVLMALDAALVLRRGEAQRTVPLDAFYLGYQRNALAEGEFVEAITLPLPGTDDRTQLRAYKLSKRYDCDISAVAAGLALRLADDGTVAEARLAFGGLAATVKRAAAAEAALIGQPWTEPALRAAQAALAQDFQPLTDLRASAAYRLRGARALLERFWLATRLHDPLPEDRLTVREAA
jgi:xanthine dehydrogenase small subunit